jgi:hypothetical protein
MHMSNTRPNIPLNDSIISTLWAVAEVSCEPLRVHARCLSVLLIQCNIRGSKANCLSDRVSPLDRSHHPTDWSAVDGKTKDHGDVLQRHRDLARWKVECVGLRTPPVHEHHQRGGVHQRQTVGDEPSKR